MSIELMSQVWKCRFTKAEQSVMLAMADHAKDDGTDCYPSIERIAWKTDYSTRQVQRVIKDLSGRAILLLVRKGGRARATEYRIDLSKADPKPDFASEKHDTMSSYSPKDDMVSPQIGPKKDDIVSSNGLKHDTMSSYSGSKRVTFDATKDDILSIKGDIAMSPQSLTIKPSEGNGIISPSDTGDVEFNLTIHPIQHLPFKSPLAKPPPPLPGDDLWSVALGELSPTLVGVAAVWLKDSRLEDAGESEGVPGYRVLVTNGAANIDWLKKQAAHAISRKLGTLLGQRVAIDIVAAQATPTGPEGAASP